MHLSDAERIAAGRAVYARNFGVTPDEAEGILTQRAGAQYAREALLAAGGPGWNGTDLTERERTIAVIAALVSQHVMDQRLVTYLNGARTAGVTEQGLSELMVLLTAYLGQPAPSAAMHVVRTSSPGEDQPFMRVASPTV